jgi:O-Antigen ligase
MPHTPLTQPATPLATADPSRMVGWLVVVLILAAPWPRAGLSVGAMHLLSGAAGVLVLMWGATLWGQRRVPGPPILLTAVTALLALGWLMALNAGSRYDPAANAFVPVAPPVAWLPGGVDRTESILAAGVASAVLIVTLVAGDLARHRVWRRRLLMAVVTSVTLVALSGIAMKLGWIDTVRWYAGRPPDSPFGPFGYHGNAASFLALGLSVLFAFGTEPTLRKRRGGLPALSTVVVLLLIGAAVNHSKVTVPLATLGLCVVAVLRWGQVVRAKPRGAVLLAVAIALTLVLVAGAVLTGGNILSGYADRLTKSAEPRLLLTKISVGMASDAGPLGLGPGTFKLAMPASPHFDPRLYRKWIVTRQEPGTDPVIWNHAHQDYLQTVIEWGWLGAAAWAVVLGGGFVIALRRVCDEDPDTRTAAMAVAAALAVIAVHALGDFPMQVPAIAITTAVLTGVGWGLRHQPRSSGGVSTVADTDLR